IGPVDQEAAPDHDYQHGDIDPVHPTNGPWVFRLQAVHDLPSLAAPAARRPPGSSLLLVYILSFLPPSILPPSILPPSILPPSILVSPILPPSIFPAPPSSLVEEVQPPIARPSPRLTTATAINCQTLRMLRLLVLSQVGMTRLRPCPCPSSV